MELRSEKPCPHQASRRWDKAAIQGAKRAAHIFTFGFTVQPEQINKIKSELVDKSSDELKVIKANGVDNQSPPAFNKGVVAGILLDEREASLRQAAERKQWWLRPLGVIAITIISNLLTAAVVYLLSRQG